MRQNPMLQNRPQAGGRSMPAWFATSLVTQSRVGAPSPPPPPLPAEPPPEESDYEEIDHLPKNAMKKQSSRRACSLCGNPNPAVSCEMCNNQIFCGSCNDMYHRHPKRQHHSRRILEPVLDNRPPIPPKTPVPHEMAMLPPLPPTHPPYQPGGPSIPGVPTPQPPPRRKGRFGLRSAAGSPTQQHGIKSFFDPVGTLKKFMGGMAHRPLPAPPKPPPPLPPKPADLGRSMTPTFRGQMMGERRLNSPQPGGYPQDERMTGIPRTVLEMQNARMHSISVANLSGHTSSRDSGYPDWEEDEETDFFSRNRAQSVSGGVLGRYPTSSQDASHFATLHRPGKRQPTTRTSTTSLSSPPQNSDGDNPPERPPPPLPPRQFPSQTNISFQNSQSAFDLDRMAAVAQQQNAAAFGMPPWNYPMAAGYPFDFQQAMMMGYPGGGTMHRTPSTQSMGPSMNPSASNQPPFFGWGPMGFGPPMSQMEMEMMTRRGSEQFMNMLPPQQQQHLPTQRAVPLSNPVTPQGSFRKKAGSRHMSVEPEFNRRLENRSGLDLAHNRRSGTPSSFVRVPPSSSSAASTPAPSSSAFASTPKPLKPPARPPASAAPASNSDQSPDDSYFSAERQQLTESSESTPEITENPEGPWECEHCTFINPKSTKVCTICCKTPAQGYRVMKGKRGLVGSKGRFAKKAAGEKGQLPGSSQSGLKRRDSSKESASSATTGTDEVVPVLKSKLSISRDQRQQQTKIDLVSKVEKERVKKSAMKAGSSGTLKAGMAPPAALKAVPVGAKKKVVKKTKGKVVAPPVESEEEEDDEELIAEPEDEEEEEAEEEDLEEGEGSGEKEEEEEEEEEEEDEREQRSEDDNADDEENGVVNVKISSKMGPMGKPGSRGKVAAAAAIYSKKQASAAAVPEGKVKAGKGARARASSSTRRLVDSNEDVYGSVPIQTLAISPKIDIKRTIKSKTSTGVGPSPPKFEEDGGAFVSIISVSPVPICDEALGTEESKNVAVSGEENLETGKIEAAVERNSPEISTVTVTISGSTSSTATPKKTKKVKKTRKLSVSTGTQASVENTDEGKTSSVTTGTETVAVETETKAVASSPSFQAGKDIGIEEETKEKKIEETVAKKDEPEEKPSKKSSSVGTSPPPQSISTQTYEDAGEEVIGVVEPIMGAPPTKSSSKSSLRSDNEQYYEAAPRHNEEMSEKAMMRYARKARNKEQHYQKLKRSLSTQLNYPGAEAWMDSVEGRHFYRSSSRQSLMDDTRSLPMSGPPSRDSSPPPMGRYSGGRGTGSSSRTGGGADWYEEFRRYPPSSSMWDSRYGMPPESFFASIDDLMARRGGRRESMRSQEFELTRMLKDAEEYNFSPEDVQVGIRMCGDKNPIKWLQENWASMVETVQTLATKYGREKGHDNDIGTVSSAEAKEAIRVNRGNVWAAVTECVDQRRKKFHELESRGTFLREDILTALTTNQGNLDAAYVELSKAQLKPFLMRIWGQPQEADGDSIAPSSSDEAALKARSTSERSASLPGPAAAAAIQSKMKAKRTRKSSLGGPMTKTEPPKQLKELVSNAEKVSQEIEKAIQELKRTNVRIPSEEQLSTDQQEPEEDMAVSQVAPILRDSSMRDQVVGTESEASSEHSAAAATAQQLKSDEGEDESFVDAVSGFASIASSPPHLPRIESSQEEAEAEEIEEEAEESFEINNNTINVLVNDGIGAELAEEFDEDVLEIEIDDREEEAENVGDALIENYEMSSAAITRNQQEEQYEEEDNERGESIEEGEEEENEGNRQEIGNVEEAGVTKVEIEKLMTALSSTFSEMEQFAYKMKENIAVEIQQQLAAAVTQKKGRKGSHDHSEDGSYEPIELPSEIEENVNKKVAKYQRLAAKKKEKVGRHKSPETAAPQLGEKEMSLSPLPSTSSGKKKLKKIKEQVKQDKLQVPREPEVTVVEETKGKEEEEVEDEEDVEREETEQGRLSDFEQVEIDQEEETEEKPQEENGEDGGEFVVQEEEEGNNESSIVEESEEEIVIEGGEEEEEPEVEDEDGQDIYANVQISTEGMSITPSDTDKVIVSGAHANLAAAAKSLKKTATVVQSEEKDVVIVAEDLTATTGQEEKTEVEEQKEEKKEVIKEEPPVEVELTPSQKLIKEGKVDNPYQAELALQLLEMNFSEDDALSAAKECSSLCSALSYLQQECDLCTGKFSAREMVSMIHCTHLCCRNCARDYFTVQVRDKTIVDATCPFCAEPTTLADDSEQATEYFNHLDILLKNLLDSKHHEMFQRKLRDWTLAKTPNFKWCSKCSSGFITEPMQTRLVCPDCKAVTCAVCMETWDKVNHDHRDEAGSSSKKLCDTVPKSIIEYLNQNHIECPRCHFRFSLARGGCMHLTCTQCHHEFCSGCAAPFRMGDKCEAKYPICDKLGLHAHHPRNCLFYLRDKEPEQLAKLLEENAIPYFKENSGEEQIVEVEAAPVVVAEEGAGTPVAEGNDADGATTAEGEKEEENEKKVEPVKLLVKRRVCQVPIQRETSDGFLDEICGKEAPKGYATVCKTHYIEYLGLLIWQNHLDPITILTNDDLEVIVRRAFKKHPGRPNWLSDELFRKRLLKVINDEIPL